MDAYLLILCIGKEHIKRILKGSLENYFRISRATYTDKAKFLEESSVSDLIDANSNEIQEAIENLEKYPKTAHIFKEGQAKAFRADIDTFLGKITFEDILK